MQPFFGRSFLVFVALLRCVLAGWIGAAVLFVITSVAEQTSEQFDSVIRDQLATIRFPLYYRFGFTIHLAGGLLAVGAWLSGPRTARRQFGWVAALIGISGALMAADYQWVYQPLQALITPAGQARTQEFVRLHDWSRHANEVHLSVLAVAAVLAAVPLRPESPVDRDRNS